MSNRKISGNISIVEEEYTLGDISPDFIPTVEDLVELGPISPIEWALINAVIYAGSDINSIRQIVQSSKFLEDTPDSDIARRLHNLGERLLDAKSYDEARSLFAAAVMIYPSFPEACIRIAETFD